MAQLKIQNQYTMILLIQNNSFLPGNHKVCDSNKLKLRIWKKSLKKWTQARIQRPVEVILKAHRRIWIFICWSVLGAEKRILKQFVLCCENQKPNSQELMQTLCIKTLCIKTATILNFYQRCTSVCSMYIYTEKLIQNPM